MYHSKEILGCDRKTLVVNVISFDTVHHKTVGSTLELSRRMLATMATLMMPAPAPTMPMNPPTLPLTPAKHEMPPKSMTQHTTANGQKPGEYRHLRKRIYLSLVFDLCGYGQSIRERGCIHISEFRVEE